MITKVVPMSCNDYILLSSYLQQDASGNEQTSKVNLERYILPGINDIVPNENGERSRDKRNQ